MRLYRENRLDREFRMSEDEIAKGFLDSDFSDLSVPIERSLAAYMSHPDGLNASWGNAEAFQRVVNAVLERM